LWVKCLTAGRQQIRTNNISCFIKTAIIEAISTEGRSEELIHGNGRLAFYIPFAPVFAPSALLTCWVDGLVVDEKQLQTLAFALFSPHLGFWNRHPKELRILIRKASYGLGFAAFQEIFLDILLSRRVGWLEELLAALLVSIGDDDVLLRKIAKILFSRIEWVNPSAAIHFINYVHALNKADVLGVLVHSLAEPYWKNNDNVIDALISTKQVDHLIVKFILTLPEWTNRSQMILQLMRNETCGRAIVRYLLRGNYAEDPLVKQYFLDLEEREYTTFKQQVSHKYPLSTCNNK